MALRVISDAAAKELAAKLMQEALVVAPHRREGRDQWAFREVSDPARIELRYISTILPPKKYAMPPVETILRYRLGEGFQAEEVIEVQPLVLFGVHPCDIYALESLDIAMTDKHADPGWVERRKAMRVVGVDCEPDEHCFCAYMKTDTVQSGYDLFLNPIKGWTEYVAEAATPAGEAMLAMVDGREANSDDIAQMRAAQSGKVRRQQTRKMNTELVQLPLHFTGFANSPVWEKWADRCYSCGTCNTTCPTCFCFDVIDQPALTLKEGTRERVWDSCQLEDFALVATGENFREERPQRVRHRFYRKYAYLFTQYGRPYCCGCGRCFRQCVANIDPVEVVNDLLAESAKEAKAHGV
ncbi:MAG: 4Fe-4S dicluster domain-containing protein [Armatimonadetes bacterium]|nr:4Fe-4S dicluster domain-containing protein [Armatimonadota bacterium]